MMFRKIVLAFSILLGLSTVNSQETKLNTSPKLVVGVVIDQMRYDYLTRFYHRFGDDGFKRMVEQGFNCKNTHFDYIPTYTGPGHASVYTGTTPKNHGIIANNWYDKMIKKKVYCASDETVLAVGTTSDREKMSPRRMKTTTISDQNRLHTQFKGKTIGIAIKDRGAILPAGHTANGAYWFRGKNEGKWITSTYYRNELPDWVQKFNASGKTASYLKEWNTLHDIKTYVESGADDSKYEQGYKGKDKPTFPYDLEKLKDQNAGFDIIKATAYGNSLTTDFAIAAIEGEALGKDEITDVLTISYSSTDYVGHNFGVNSKEIQDTYLRLDQDLAKLFKTLDTKVGKGKYTVFLTADHGAVHVPSYLMDQKIPSGYFDGKDFRKQVAEFVKKKFNGSDLIENISNNQLFFNYEALQKLNINREVFEKELKAFIINHPQVDKVYTRTEMESTQYTEGIERTLQKGFNQKRSGDILLVLNPATISYPKAGSTHGSGLTYDTHAPLLFYGQGIAKGSTVSKTYITDIAPTIAALLGIAFPNGATGEVLPFVIE